MLAVLAFQAIAEPGPGLISLGVGGGIACLVITLWRQDRKDSQERYAALAKDSIDRAATIAENFRLIVQENSRAITTLTQKIETAEEHATVIRLLTELLKQGCPTIRKVNLEP